MKLSEVKTQLTGMEKLSFELPDGTFVPAHFHVTEVGVVDKQFIDCGGTVRREKVASLQLWQANDYDHRLAPQKLLSIIELSERVLEMEDLEVEVEYQADTIGKYKLGMGKKRLHPATAIYRLPGPGKLRDSGNQAQGQAF
jgi:hypothetical protein